MSALFKKNINLNIDEINFDSETSCSTAFQYFKNVVSQTPEIKNMTKDMSKSKKQKFINNTTTFLWRNKLSASADSVIKNTFIPLEKKDIHSFISKFKSSKKNNKKKKKNKNEIKQTDLDTIIQQNKTLTKIILILQSKVQENELQINTLNAFIIPNIWGILKKIAAFIKFPMSTA